MMNDSTAALSCVPRGKGTSITTINGRISTHTNILQFNVRVPMEYLEVLPGRINLRYCTLSKKKTFCQRASCATYRRDPCTLLHERLSTDSARSETMQRHWDDLKSIAQQELTLSIFHAMRSLIRLVFITSHLVCYSP